MPVGLDQQAATRERLQRAVRGSTGRAASEIARLSLRAPFAGKWMDVDPQWRAGQWINPKEPVGVLVDPRRWQVDAYVKQDEVQRLAPGDSARFYPIGQAVADRRPRASPSTPRACGNSTIRCSRRATRGRYAVAVGARRADAQPAAVPCARAARCAPAGLWETRGQLQIDGDRRSLLIEGWHACTRR